MKNVVQITPCNKYEESITLAQKPLSVEKICEDFANQVTFQRHGETGSSSQATDVPVFLAGWSRIAGVPHDIHPILGVRHGNTEPATHTKHHV